MLVNIANEQIIEGHNVHIVIIDSNIIDDSLVKCFNSNIIVHYINRKYGTKDILAYYRLNKTLLSLNPNVIHLHSASIYKYLIPSLRKICNNTLHALCNSSNTNFIKYIPKVFAISQTVADDLALKRGVRSIVIHNGIHPEQIKVKQKNRPESYYKIVQVGRLDHNNKGQDILIHAGYDLKKRGYKNFKIFLIGDGSSCEYLEKLVCQLGLSDDILFMGAKDQDYIFTHLCEYDLFIQPSRKEGFGLTVAEAMAAKLPVIVSSGQGPEEIVGYGEFGYVFQNGDHSNLADIIEIFLKGENDQSMLNKAYKRVWDLYNIKITAKTYLENYICR